MTNSLSRSQIGLAIAGVILVFAAIALSIVPLILPPPNPNPTERFIGATNEPEYLTEPILGDDFDEGDLEDEGERIAEVLMYAYDLKVQSLENASTEGLDDMFLGPALIQRTEAVERAQAADCAWQVELTKPEEYFIQSIDNRLAEVIALREETWQCRSNSIEDDAYMIHYYLTNQDGNWRVVDMKVTDIREGA